MNYKNKVVAISGTRGFIGQALFERLTELGAFVEIITGDIRDPKTFGIINYEHDYLFHFAAPSSQIQFQRDPQYCAETTMLGFNNALKACQRNCVKLVYPSTGLLSQGKVNDYALCKMLCENMASRSDALGLRIFATYGPGEGHKRDYASVPYLFARDIVEGRSPIVFGDGQQSRDFIYIDDVVESILECAERCNDKVIDIGSGGRISFNSVVAEINKNVKKPMVPEYMPVGGSYVQETLADASALHRFYIPKTTFAEGIKRIVKELKA